MNRLHNKIIPACFIDAFYFFKLQNKYYFCENTICIIIFRLNQSIKLNKKYLEDDKIK